MPDEEKTKYIPMELTVDIDVPGTVGAIGKGSVVLNNRPFVLQKIKHQIIFQAFDLTVAKLNNYFNQQHGMYRLDWSIHETARFWKGTPPMADTYGSVRTGIWDPLDAPLVIDGNDTLNVAITNEFLNVAGAPPAPVPYRVQIKFCGVERVQ